MSIPISVSETLPDPLWRKIVLGTAGIGGVWGKVEEDASVKTILDALENGIWQIDTAPAYSEAERYVGIALKVWTGSKPFISTKVGRLKSRAADKAVYDYSPAAMEKSVVNSIKTLGVEAIDLLFLHDPEAIPPEMIGSVVDHIQLLRHKGYARQIGLGGNFTPHFDKYIREQYFDVIMEFNRLNACNTTALEVDIPLCKSLGILFYAASPLNMGLLGARYADYTNFPPNWISPAAVSIARRLKELSDRNDLSLSSLAHRFLFSISDIDKIVLGAANPEELQASLQDIKNGPLPDELFQDIRDIIYKS